MPDAEIAGVAARLALDGASAQVLELFAGMGVPAALLKGPSLLGWLYETNVAPYTDVDVLIRPQDEAKADRALESLGFTRSIDDTTAPVWLREHGSEWLRAEDGVPVDM